MTNQTPYAIPRRLALATAASILLAVTTIAPTVQAATDGMERRGDRRDDRQDDRGDRRDTRQDCRDDEGVGKDKRDCKQDGRQDRRDGDDDEVEADGKEAEDK